MKIFDFNIHLPFLESKDVNKVIENDMSLSAQGLLSGFEYHKSKFSNLQGANFLLFNTDLFSESIQDFKLKSAANLHYKSITALIDFRRPDLMDYLHAVKSSGANAVMVNSYLQQISEKDFQIVNKIFQFADKNNLIICIDGSYGTSKMYTYDNLKLACFAADLISQTPIVIIHSGGLRVKEAMLLALEKKNVYLDSSFSLPFYMGSSLEQDYAYAFKQIGANRILYGSDIPYMNSENAQKIHFNFFKKYRFKDSEIESIMFYSALKLLSFE